MIDRQAPRLTLAAFLLVVLIGGTNFVAVRFSLRELSPFWGAALRFAAASIVLFALVFLQRLPIPRGRALAGAVVYGILGFGAGYAFGYQGLRHVPAGTAAVVLAATPLLTFALALLHGQEPFKWRPMIGGLIALLGIGWMFRSSVSAAVPLASLLALVATALCTGEASVVVKSFPKSHPVTTNAIAMVTGTVILAVLSFVVGEPHGFPVRASTWTALAYLVLIGSSAVFVLFLYVLRSWSASTTAYQFVLFPLVAVLMSAWLERAPVTPSLLAGGGLVLAGVFAGTVSKGVFVRTPHRIGSEPCLTCAE